MLIKLPRTDQQNSKPSETDESKTVKRSVGYRLTTTTKHKSMNRRYRKLPLSLSQGSLAQTFGKSGTAIGKEGCRKNSTEKGRYRKEPLSQIAHDTLPPSPKRFRSAIPRVRYSQDPLSPGHVLYDPDTWLTNMCPI